ncbi:MAG TPA: glycoside hydrolase family 2 TIM barrel-domain containing protein [Planctomycetota bacterium]|nr:glycoside hydrolase family 2 TIM barrel-domain containing protein [Planctomycetota bacterium]HRR82196.1 glycoside hydrolase family 2 TIM barrel-domain containing protein [Planctomycetota bacterium]HRT97285.1 glycoside hydrolase family 2 TIM barrel-domain containing protein [Planctomycetota bacterium]
MTAHPGDLPRPEHPRPDFQRDEWLNLNGVWQFEVDDAGDGESRGLITGRDLAQTILVPFCPESRLSGIGRTDFMEHVWYRRTFQVPASKRGKRLLLHFGAVDWHARAWVNGAFVGEHRGGYSPFTFDITRAARPGDNELVLHVTDRTRSGLQATGKQSHKPESHGCHYTRTTGIWQTVWLEAVGETCLRDLALYPDLDTGRVFFNAHVDGPTDGVEVRLTATLDDEIIGEEAVGAAWRSTLGVLELSEINPWFPGEPALYDLLIEIERDGEPIDTVRSYFGLRKLALDGHRFLINGRPVFQRLVLDQGFYPDGIYTAPTDEALRRDIEISMAAGFNGARLHQKVFEPRFLYWADRLGYLAWGEYADWGLNRESHEALAHALHEWRSVVVRDRNHPSIVGWCPLNETRKDECHASAQRLFAVTQTLDPTRPFLDTSGYVHLYPETDIYDCHDYCQKPAEFAQRFADPAVTSRTPWSNNQEDPRSAYRGQPYFVSEYGGIRFETGRDVGQGWGYGGETISMEQFFERYKALTDVLLDNPHMFGFCYTQLTDVEQEQNGIVFYDRQLKYDLARLRAINTRQAAYEKE